MKLFKIIFLGNYYNGLVHFNNRKISYERFFAYNAWLRSALFLIMVFTVAFFGYGTINSFGGEKKIFLDSTINSPIVLTVITLAITITLWFMFLFKSRFVELVRNNQTRLKIYGRISNILNVVFFITLIGTMYIYSINFYD